MLFVKLFCYILACYGISNLIVYSKGPFRIFEIWRHFSHSMNDNFGELFTCMLCMSTWIGLVMSLLNIYFVDIPLTPFNIILGLGEYKVLTVILDMAFTSAVVWLLHQLEEMMERTGLIGNYEEIVEDEDNGSE